MIKRREFITRASVSLLVSGALLTPFSASTKEPKKTTLDKSSSPGVQTVLGPISVSKLGMTLPHEHVLSASPGFFRMWPEVVGGRDHFINKAVAHLRLLKEAGVDTIVDATPVDIGRDVQLLKEVSQKSGMQIIVSTGQHLLASPSVTARSESELTELYIREIEEGIEGTTIRAGVIKVATDEPLSAMRAPLAAIDLEKVLKAGAQASKYTGAPIITHTSAHVPSAQRIGSDSSRAANATRRVPDIQAEIFESMGVPPSRVCLGHLDSLGDYDYLASLAKRGYMLGMDHFTIGIGNEAFGVRNLLSWKQRADTVKQLIEAGFVNNIFLSNDWTLANTLVKAGIAAQREKINPDGMLFLLRKVIPYLKQMGVGNQMIDTMTVQNPRRFFSDA